MHQELVISQNIGGQLQVLRKNRSFIESSWIQFYFQLLRKSHSCQSNLECHSFRFTRTGQARWGTREFTLSSGTRFLSIVLPCSCICQEGQGYTWLDLTNMIKMIPGADSPSGRGLEQQGDERAAPQLPHLRRCSPQCAWLVSGHFILLSISIINIYILNV